jgi:hypothetical protein
MGVNNATNVGTQAINQQVHADFAGDAALAGEALAVHVNDDHVGSPHTTFADAGRGDKQAFFVEADGQIAVGSRDKTVLVQQSSELHNLETMLTVAGHRNSCETPAPSWYSTSPKPYNHYLGQVM